jgi:DAK2 domain fusion protein YloV
MQSIAAANGWTLLRMLESAVDWLEPSAESLDALNVFPVPDGDTGTNMLLTVRAALTAASSAGASAAGASAAAVSAAMARGAMEGARGNSGIILSQFFRGLAFALEAREVCSPEDLAAAFTRAESFARAGISDPTEGTILTVLADVARALSEGPASNGGSLAAALETAVEAAAASTERTPSLLPVLRESGVVDAGAKGMLLILEGCLCALEDGRAAAARAPLPASMPSRFPNRAGSYGFCTEFLLSGESLPLASVRARLEQQGTSVILVGDGATARVHIHTNQPEAVIEYARSVGSVSRLEVQDLDKQCAAVAVPSRIAVISLVEGDGIAAVFRSMGAEVVVADPRAGWREPGEIARALGRVSARQVILLPSSNGAREVAEKARVPEGTTVRVVPSRSVPQGIAALIAFRLDNGLEANVAAMSSALGAVRTLEVAAGTTDSVLALEGLLAKEEAGSVEVVTIYRGAGADESLAECAVAACRRFFPRAVVDCVPGGQASPLLIISLE